MMPLLTAVCMLTQTVSSSQPHILHVVADDLGANDLGIKNGGKTLTPTRGEYRVVFNHHRGRFVCGLAHLRKFRARRTQKNNFYF
jgi:hypothetical protein